MNDRAAKQQEQKRLRLVKKQQLFEERKKLPIYSAKKDLIDEIRNNQSLVIVGETGSGKTTQIPQYIAEAGLTGRGKLSVAITQPRRVAAITISQRVADEMGVIHGEEVGYCIRFDDHTSKNTFLKYMTDGMLLREAMLDATLSKYSVIIIDEAHERTVHTDILFGILKGIQKTRPELKLIIMSATLDADQFASYFNAKVLYIDGRQFPVDVYYTDEAQTDYVDSTMIAILQIHLEFPVGDILVFLTGREEIDTVEKLLLEKIPNLPKDALNMIVCPIYAALPPEEQMKAFEKTPEGSRKVILATNIAETSITISGIKYVIDTGMAKSRAYNPKIGIETLMVAPVSKAAARQRAGRAGRESSGSCFRLYREEDFLKLDDTSVPEIKRCSLSTIILQMRAIGIDDVINFDYLDRPPQESIKRALMQLYALGAITDKNALSDLGKKMAELPLDPTYARVLLASKDFGCSEEALSIISMLSVESDSIFFIPKNKKKVAANVIRKFQSIEGDQITLLNVFNAYVSNRCSKPWCIDNFINARSLAKALDVRKQLLDYCHQLEIPLMSCGSNTETVRKCFVTGFFMQAALLQPDGATYRTILESKIVSVHPVSVLFGKKANCVLYNELLLTKKQYIRDVMVIDYSWLMELASHYYETK